DFLVKIPRKSKRPPKSNSGQNARSENVYNHGDTIKKNPIKTSKTKCICKGNCFTKPVSLSTKTAMMNCSQPINIGINKAALDTLANPNSQGAAISVKLNR